jgi:hypothetical protein
MCPTVQALTELATELKEKHKENFIAYFDLHGHSVRKNIFTYGPYFPI